MVCTAEELPAKVQIAAGPAVFVCWSMKPIAMGEKEFIRLANSKLFCWAICFGMPCLTNCTREVWKLNRPWKAGEGRTGRLRELLPCSHRLALVRLARTLLRVWMTRSLPRSRR